MFVCLLYHIFYHLFLFVQNGRTLLHAASYEGHEGLVVYLLSMGATVNIQNDVSLDIYIV